MKIKFHGFLKKLCTKEFYEIVADTPAEAIRGLSNQLKQLRRIGGNRWVCRVKECPTRDDLYSVNKDLVELNLYPDYSPAGGGKAGMTAIIIGAIIIAVALMAVVAVAAFTAITTATTFGAAFTAAASSSWAVGAFLMGGGMILSGLAQMLVKVPKGSTDSSKSNKYFNSGGNTTDIGTRIAVGYGKYKFYGQMLSIQQESY